MRIAVELLVCTALIIAAGWLYGVNSDRWNQSEELENALARLPFVPSSMGDWQDKDDQSEQKRTFDDADMKRNGIKGWLSRDFHNLHTHETISMLIVCGRGGPISVHTPDVCYTGTGFKQLGEPQQKTIKLEDGRNATFMTLRFIMPGVVPKQIEVCWSWSADGTTWQAPQNPRLTLARLPALYKMYVVRAYAPGTAEADADTCSAFLQRALPEISSALSRND